MRFLWPAIHEENDGKRLDAGGPLCLAVRGAPAAPPAALSKLRNSTRAVTGQKPQRARQPRRARGEVGGYVGPSSDESTCRRPNTGAPVPISFSSVPCDRSHRVSPKCKAALGTEGAGRNLNPTADGEHHTHDPTQCHRGENRCSVWSVRHNVYEQALLPGQVRPWDATKEFWRH